MAYGRWAGDAVKGYGSNSEYGKGLDLAKKLEHIKLLTGQDYDPLKSQSYDKLGRSAESQYKNLFEPVQAKGGFGKRGVETGEFQLKADAPIGKGFGGGFKKQTNASLADSLKNQAITEAYDKAIQDVYETHDLSKEDAAKYGMNDYGMKWVSKKNRLTGETEVTQDKDDPRESNFYRRYKDNIITVGGGILGGILGSIVPGIGTAYGAMAGAGLAKSTRDAYKARAARRKIHDLKRDWENDPRNQPWQPTGANLYQSAGEGVVEYATKDVEKKKKGQYVREEE